MSPNPARDTPAGRAYNDLRNLARRQGRDPSEYLALYALEGFLVRLAASEHAGGFVLKGGVLLAAFAARRPTRDIDLAVSGLPNAVEDVETRVRAVTVATAEDGLVFDPETVRSAVIRDDADYPGVRVHVVAELARARIPIHIDVNFGDPIWPAPQDTALPRILGGEMRLLAYPLPMVLAEKIVTAIDRGTANTRWRDFVDLGALSRTQRVTASVLSTAITTVADHRGVGVRSLAEALVGMADVAQGGWSAWRRKQRLTESTPESFQLLLDEVVAFADPALTDTADGLSWHPSTRRWTR